MTILTDEQLHNLQVALTNAKTHAFNGQTGHAIIAIQRANTILEQAEYQDWSDHESDVHIPQAKAIGK